MEYTLLSVTGNSNSDSDDSSTNHVTSHAKIDIAEVSTVISDAKLPGNSDGDGAKSSEAQVNTKIADIEVHATIPDATVASKFSHEKYLHKSLKMNMLL